MKKSLILLFVMALMLTTSAVAFSDNSEPGKEEQALEDLTSTSFARGDETETDPWQIATLGQWNNVRNYLWEDHNDKHFLQVADIDLNVLPWNTGEGWEPIGNGTNRFFGNFDGNGHTIENLYINRPETNNIGLFGYLGDQGILENVALLDVTVNGYDRVGSLIGHSVNDLGTP